MSADGHRARTHAWAVWLLGALVLVVGTASTLAVASTRQRQFDDDAALRLGQQREQVRSTFVQTLGQVDTVLRSAGSFVAASDHVSQQEWVRYAAGVGDVSRQGMDGLGIVVPVAWADRETFVEGLLTEVPQGSLRTTGTDHELAVVTAATKGPEWVGFDVAQGPERRAALDAARDSGALVITDPVHRLSDTDVPVNERPWTYVLYAPVYRTGQVPGTVEGRRRELAGWVTSSVTATNVASLFATTGMDVSVYDGRAADEARLMATTLPSGSTMSGAGLSTTVVDYGGHAWTLGMAPQASEVVESGAGIVLVAGLIVTFAIVCLTMQLALQRHRLRAQVTDAVSGLEAANERLAQQALYDGLTRLPNRNLFHDRLDHALERSRRSGELHAVLFLDVDHFKSIIDEHGHAAGDRVLRTMSAKLVDVLRSSDSAARLGGDEFVVLCEAVESFEAAQYLAERVAHAVEGRYEVDGTEIDVAVSVGMTLARTGDRADDVLAAADRAMYRVKREHHGGDATVGTAR